MLEPTFRSTASHYTRNTFEGANIQAQNATLENYDGHREPAIAFRTKGLPRFVIPTADALRLANQIADIATTQKLHPDE